MSDTATSSRCGCGHSSPGDAHQGCGCGGGAHGSSAHMEVRACSRAWRQAHAVLGTAITVFLVFHLGVAALAASPARFEAIATKLHRLGAAFPPLLPVLLMLLAAVAMSGMRVFLRGRPAMRRDESSLRMLAQRWTGVLVLGFVAVHVAMALMRGAGNTPAAAGAALFAGNHLLVVFYAICLPAIAWHAGHGIWTGASVWGLRESNRAFWRAAAVVIGLLLLLLGGVALRALSA